MNLLKKNFPEITTRSLTHIALKAVLVTEPFLGYLHLTANYKQKGQCRCNVTLRRVRESLLLWKSNTTIIYWSLCACVRVRACGRVGVYMRIRAHSLANSACNAYSSYCDVICGPPGHHPIFRHCLINGRIFGKTLLSIKCVFQFSLQLCLKHFLL